MKPAADDPREADETAIRPRAEPPGAADPATAAPIDRAQIRAAIANLLALGAELGRAGYGMSLDEVLAARHEGHTR
jgi:hypothetical protein